MPSPWPWRMARRANLRITYPWAVLDGTTPSAARKTRARV